MIIEQAGIFWECVMQDIPPTLQTKQDVLLAHPQSQSVKKEADARMLYIHQKLKEQKSALRKTKNEAEKLEDKLTLFMRDADTLIREEKTLATWKCDKNGHRILRIY
jgi:septal ring factor EnvC (AmiA/AmiB activator)